jgi:hypothetical protein
MIDEIYAFDLRAIEAENDRLIAQEPVCVGLLTTINVALDFLAAVPIERKVHEPGELALFRLMIRVFNSGAGALHLARGGLYQQSAALLRDVMETTFLLDLFASHPAELTEWRTLSPGEREKRFKPWQVRKKLDERDGFKERKREAAYKRLSAYGAHPTPEGFAIVSPGNVTQLGPFPSQTHFQALLEEAAMRIVEGALKASLHAREPRTDLIARRTSLLAQADWLIKSDQLQAQAQTTPPPQTAPPRSWPAP